MIFFSMRSPIKYEKRWSKDHLPLVRRNDLTTLDECVVCEFKSTNNYSIMCLLYCSPSQDFDQFKQFLQKLEETIINVADCRPSVSTFLGDFNARILLGGRVITLTIREFKLQNWLLNME